MPSSRCRIAAIVVTGGGSGLGKSMTRYFLELGARYLLPMHWGTFDLTFEPVDEAARELERVIAEQGWAFFTHDPAVAAAKITRDERGKFSATESLAQLAWDS